MNYSSEQLLKIYKTLPEELRAAITSLELDLELEKIGKEHGLSETQQKELNRQTLFLLMKLTPVSLFSEEIEHSIHTTVEVSHQLAEKVETRVCGEVINLLTNPAKSPLNNEPISREQVLSEIEDPLPHKELTIPPQNLPSTQSNLVDTKLSGLTRMPKEEITVSSPINKASPTPQPAVVPSTPLPEKKTYQGFDPYREQPK